MVICSLHVSLPSPPPHTHIRCLDHYIFCFSFFFVNESRVILHIFVSIVIQIMLDSVIRKTQEKIQKKLKRAGGGAKYFSSARRGEAAELKNDLNSTDFARQKSAVKRTIANITLGRDASSLFVDVVKLGQTHNLELKKLVYLYVLTMARLQPEKALLAVNTFLQDASHTSPIIRALAVRTMLCLRVPDVVEYTLEPLRRAMVDTDPYVRKTAAIGIGKIFHHEMEIFYNQSFANDLVKLLKDTYPIVSANAAAVLTEVNDYGPLVIEINPEWIKRLLIQLPDCSEWGQQYILEVLVLTRPKDEETAEDMVAQVMGRLNHTNPAVVMAAIKVITCFANRCAPSSMERFSSRINAALITLAKSDPETIFVVCKNIHALLVVFPNVLRRNLDSFYVRFTDPTYVKLEKLRLLLKLVTPKTAPGVVREFEEYSQEVELRFVEEVVRATAALALKIEAVSPDCANLLMQTVERRPELLPYVVTAAKDISRKYPLLLLLDPLIKDFGADNVVEEEAKVSLIWMLGEYCDYVEGGPVYLQRFIDSLMVQETTVQLAILSAVVKMFIRSPQEMQPTLNSVLETITHSSGDPDVRDRAFAYWRLLSKGISVANMKEIVHGHTAPINVDNTFSDAMTIADLKKSINTAAVVFGKPYQSFLPPYGLPDSKIDEDDDDDLFFDEDGQADEAANEATGAPAAGMDDLFAAPVPAPEDAPPAQQANSPENRFASMTSPSHAATAPKTGGTNIDDLFS
ncbi:AP-1 complex subunit beta-1 [Strigomonas culicis]|uniref:AP complex subunit beta n=1 Tax=Strigomonas culicis TaxID=28005 RepID=S9VUM0_9TRYP|nr:AP-1 complex subunit beta-1 [Strigomonas culicis]|eukprot:EPY26960.1 AP-1 complex subunit beta-1 [Strigomonas culicis]